jgi:hypothetical protein
MKSVPMAVPLTVALCVLSLLSVTALAAEFCPTVTVPKFTEAGSSATEPLGVRVGVGVGVRVGVGVANLNVRVGVGVGV